MTYHLIYPDTKFKIFIALEGPLGIKFGAIEGMYTVKGLIVGDTGGRKQGGGIMAYSGGCNCIRTSSEAAPIDVHTCHCSVCKRVTGQPTTHVAFFNHGDLSVDNPDLLNRQPFNDQNPDGPLELCTCKNCGAPIMLDDKQKRIRAVAPNLMGFDPDSMPATYHAFYDPATGVPKPDDGRPVCEGLRPDFVWPEGS